MIANISCVSLCPRGLQVVCPDAGGKGMSAASGNDTIPFMAAKYLLMDSGITRQPITNSLNQ